MPNFARCDYVLRASKVTGITVLKHLTAKNFQGVIKGALRSLKVKF